MLMIALSWMTDQDPDTGLTHVPNSTGKLPSGLIDPETYEALKYSGLAFCRVGLYGCSEGPGQQIVIWYEANDGDTAADIEVAALHVLMADTQFEHWNKYCSGRGDTNRIAIYSREIAKPTNEAICRVALGTDLGEASLIGYTTGTHLHYQVHLDDQGPDDNDIFLRPYSSTVPMEAVDPVVSYDMHMPPWIGGKD